VDFNAVELVISDDVSEAMEERGVREEDIRAVLAAAEQSGDKLYNDEGHFLARARLDNFSAYVEYVLNDSSVEIIDAYSHKVSFASDEE